ncbi:uncharacterized protein LOC109920381 [Rhincodon typus]|uniref:uncharacterized protein LOC109920381 n=1 Tax=Rhincodon typus TaxID=259920 RepID=UPI002030AF73|nr:uncharacterized protein LOC109920381 [Rhincodon typus]
MDVANHGLVLLQQLNIQREFGFLCDCTVAVGDIHFKAHRSVLAAFSNYFKMIFIHQSSDYIKVQPVDIQPDIFSYLLHLMYTGKGPKQPVDPNRLEEGIRFLHAYNLVHEAGHAGQVFVQHPDVLPLQSPNLYGIQISGSQKLAVRDVQPPSSRSGTTSQGADPLCQVSVGVPSNIPEHRYARAPVNTASSQDAAGQLTLDDYDQNLSAGSRGGPSMGLQVPGLNFKRGKHHKLYSCHYCGERFSVRSSLRDHLYSHASGALPHGVASQSRTLADPPEPGEEAEKPEGVQGSGTEPPLMQLDQQDSTSQDEQPPVALTLTIDASGDTVETTSSFGIAKRRKFACSVCGHSPDADCISPSPSFQPSGGEDVLSGKHQQEASKSRDGQVAELEAAFREVFAQYDSGQVHAHYKCQRLGCERVQPDYRRGDKFVHKWLSDRDLTYCERTGIYWLLYEEGQGMYCYLCRRHDTQNKQNKTKVFNGTPAVRYKKSALQVHAESQQHAAAVHAELTGRMSEREMAEKEKEEGAALHALFLAAYWLAREELPTAKLLSVLRLLAEAGLKGATHFRRPDTLREVFVSLGQVIRNRLVSRVRQAGCYGLLSDRVTSCPGADAEDPAALAAFIQYVDPKTAEVSTNFLFVQTALLSPESDPSEELAALISRTVARLELPVQRMASLVTDGGEVMTSERVGVAARLQELNPSLIAFHCLCHRLMLAGASSCPECCYLLRVESYLQQLWELLEKCTPLAEAYLNMGLEKALPSRQLKMALLRRLKRASRRRRVSFQASVEGAYSDYPTLLRALSQFEQVDTTACGLVTQMRNVRFAGALYILQEVSPILAGLSKVFRKGTVNYFTLEPSIKYTIYKLNEAAGSREALTRLKADLLPTGRLASAGLLPPSPQQEAELSSLLDAYVTAIKADLQRRFGASLPLVSAFSIFNPLLVPSPESADFAEYGQPEMRALAAHFYREAEGGETKLTRLLAEWAKLKFDLHTWKNNVPDSVLTDTRVTVTEWCLRRLFTLKTELHRSCAALLPLAEVSLSMPITNSWSERGLGALRRITGRLRGGCSFLSEPSTQLLNSLMHISVNGPEFGTNDCSQVVQEAALLFLQQRRHRFAGAGAGGVGSSVQEKPHPPSGKWEEAAESCSSETPDICLPSEQDLEQLQQELDEAASVLQLPLDGDSDSDDSLCD